MKALLVAFVLFASFNAAAGPKYPTAPNPNVTPGSLCSHPDKYRYPENIPYCSRNVSSGLKWEIIRAYDQRFGYQIANRRDLFKIDHYIPLCAGGSNSPDNLWPQHQSVYERTDPLEQLVCVKMSEGKLRQRQALDLIRKGKNNLELIPRMLKYLNSL